LYSWSVVRYSVNTKTLAGATATLVIDIQASHNADQAATRIETYGIVYHDVAETFKNLMPLFLKTKAAGTLTTLERQSMLESSADERGRKKSHR
jgi:hypothetical protein